LFIYVVVNPSEPNNKLDWRFERKGKLRQFQWHHRKHPTIRNSDNGSTLNTGVNSIMQPMASTSPAASNGSFPPFTKRLSTRKLDPNAKK
jgi:hypothetical protein